MQQSMVVTNRDCPARRVPSGEPAIIPKGQFVTINQDLGGNYTVTFQGNMLRIDGTDADTVGREVEVLEFVDNGSGQINEQQVWQALNSILIPKSLSVWCLWG